MQASNNSSSLKGKQELKTKGTIWKPLITASLLSVFSFTSGQYLPYVIAAVSGSGAIEALPLAIFAVSTAVALISTIYLIRLAVSRADNKKEEPQKFVCENCTNLENEPTEKEFDKSVTFGTQPNSSVSAPPLPPPPMPTPEQLNQASVAARKNSANTTGEKSPVGTTQKNTTTKKFALSKDPKQVSVSDDMIINAMKNLRKVPTTTQGQKQDGGDSNSMDIGWILARRAAMKLSDDEDEHENDSDISNDEWDESNDKHSTPKNPQLDSNKRRNSSDSDYGSGSELTSPPNPVPKAGKPPVPPKPTNLKTGPQAPSATTVTNEAGKLPASSVKERCGMFGGADTKFKRGSVLVR